MNICYICSEYPPGPHGGIGTFTQLMARALTDAGHHVRVVGIYPAEYPAADYEEDRGVPVWRLREPDMRFGWLLARHRLFRLVARWARNREIDLVELPDADGWAAGWWPLPVPVIARLHGSMAYFAVEMGQGVRRLGYLIERASLRRADFRCSTSHYTARRTESLFGTRHVDAVVYNGTAVPAAVSTSSRMPQQVVYTGTLTPKKGVVSLIRAWPLVVDACPTAELHLFGKDGRTDAGTSMQGHLEAELPLGIRSTVHFHGSRPRADVLEALARASVSVFPSYAEAFALAPLESMATGCATIYSARGSGSELIEHERDGLLVDPDRPDDIASAIGRLITDEALARRLGEAGRIKVRERFAIDKIAGENTAFYEWCLENFDLRGAGARSHGNLRSVKAQ